METKSIFRDFLLCKQIPVVKVFKDIKKNFDIAKCFKVSKSVMYDVPYHDINHYINGENCYVFVMDCFGVCRGVICRDEDSYDDDDNKDTLSEYRSKVSFAYNDIQTVQGLIRFAKQNKMDFKVLDCTNMPSKKNKTPYHDCTEYIFEQKQRDRKQLSIQIKLAKVLDKVISIIMLKPNHRENVKKYLEVGAHLLSEELKNKFGGYFTNITISQLSLEVDKRNRVLIDFSMPHIANGKANKYAMCFPSSVGCPDNDYMFMIGRSILAMCGIFADSYNGDLRNIMLNMSNNGISEQVAQISKVNRYIRAILKRI